MADPDLPRPVEAADDDEVRPDGHEEGGDRELVEEIDDGGDDLGRGGD